MLVCNMSAIVWYFEHSLALPFFGIGMKLTFSSAVATADFFKFAGILNAEPKPRCGKHGGTEYTCLPGPETSSVYWH